MVSSRPLLYLSLPGLAFILGVVWFRRRNKNRTSDGECDNGDKEKSTKLKKEQDEFIKNTTEKQKLIKGVPPPSKSMNINGSIPSNDESSATKSFGKSAPIKIIQNSRSSPMKQTHQIDSEVLKTKIQDVEHKVLRSIDEDFENLSSPVDLPDSVSCRTTFYRNVNSQKDEPVVIKATITPKISPENSFLESKYIKECEQNNNCETDAPSVEETQAPRHTNAANKKQQQVTLYQKQKNVVLQDQQQKRLQQPETQKDLPDKTIDSNGNEMRNVNASSPALSICSAQSGDSGKGSSLPRSEATRGKATYEFFFPTSLIGHLYGRNRSFINHVQAKTAANVVLRKNHGPSKVRVCVVEGTESEINAALLMIRQRLPAKRYPNFTMHRIHFALPQSIVPLSTESLHNLQLNLFEGINNDIVVSVVISGGHIFVQHPLHPSHPSLAVLQKCLYDSYSTSEAPLLPSIEISAVCVMPVNGIWYRVQIIEKDDENEERCVVKFLDFGGYMDVNFNELRQIRSDFMGLPFQATACVLSNIEPIGSSWSPEAADVLCKLTKGIVLQAQVAGYNNLNIPEVYLFASLGPNNVIFINKELVARNLAQWVEVLD